MSITYEWIVGGLVNQDLLQECSSLYSNHYGCWSMLAPSASGKRIQLSAARIKDWFASSDASIYLARNDGELIGYAIAITVNVPRYGIISWVTQLVVHSQFRKKDVAKTILFSIWGLSHYFAWGIISANPYAVRALEKSTRRRCSPLRMLKNKAKLLKIGSKNVPYIKEDTELVIGDDLSIINTGFFVNHSTLATMIESVASVDVPWLIGDLKEGWEWFAFTFQDQKQIDLSAQEIEKMLEASDQVTRKAYSLMKLSGCQKWMRHSDKETDHIIEYCQLQPGQTVIDFGCGNGRHSHALSKRGIHVFGIDYIESNIEHAKNEAKGLINIRFSVDDCRTAQLDMADSIICLYDVIGSFADNRDNLLILANISHHLKIGGFALISVMNYEVTRFNAKYTFNFSKDPNQILNLPASNIMETTGNIFDPEYYLVDEEAHVVYRREQFQTDQSFPVELVVRDRRFTMSEIEDMCRSVYLDVVWSRYICAGKWDIPLRCHDSAAKEILILCKKQPMKA